MQTLEKSQLLVLDSAATHAVETPTETSTLWQFENPTGAEAVICFHAIHKQLGAWVLKPHGKFQLDSSLIARFSAEVEEAGSYRIRFQVFIETLKLDEGEFNLNNI